MSTTKETTYIVCWKRGKEYNYFYCGEEEACIKFIDAIIEAGFEIVGIDVIEGDRWICENPF